ncbi:hypothetical protein [Vreelandella massiliensis]|uniref:hypothetical protein n=1 Tax=Vreelandella massiliensis TaxID=1816686 RepID=UPI0011817AD2|nr:hypothetical protein [Halomonas massiliensis]
MTSVASQVPLSDMLSAAKATSDRIDRLVEALTFTHQGSDLYQLQKTNKNRVVAIIRSRQITHTCASKASSTPPLDNEAPLKKWGFLLQQAADLLDAAEQAFALDMPDVALPVLAQSAASLLQMVDEAERNKPVKKKNQESRTKTSARTPF